MNRQSNGFDTFYPFRIIPEEEYTLRDKGYRFLGWQISSDTNDDLKACVNKGPQQVQQRRLGKKAARHPRQ